MTYPEFLEALRRTPRDWQIVNGRIRRNIPANHPAEHQCPITAVDCGHHAVWAYERAATALGLSSARSIACAADHKNKNSKIRRDLLKACGLKESA